VAAEFFRSLPDFCVDLPNEDLPNEDLIDALSLLRA
jgi:hypothetical protein